MRHKVYVPDLNERETGLNKGHPFRDAPIDRGVSTANFKRVPGFFESTLQLISETQSIASLRFSKKRKESQMKKAFFLLLITFVCVQSGFAQVYFVTRVAGNVYFNHKPLKLRDKLTSVSYITSNDKNAELCLFSPQKGKLRLTFANSKPIPMGAGEANKSELYELTVGEFLLDYTYNKILTARGDFDLFTFFNNAKSEDGTNKILLVEGEALPVKSAKLNTQPGDKFFFCAVSGKDTLCNEITRTRDVLVFDQAFLHKIATLNSQNAGEAPGMIKIGYIEKNDYREEYFPKPVYITFLKQADLHVLVDLFKQGLSTRYHNSKDELLADIEDHLAYCYGNFYQPAIEQLVLADLN